MPTLPSMMASLCLASVMAALALAPTLAQAACPTATTQFRAYQADINGDGVPDVLFVPQPTAIMVPLGDDDALIPLVVDPGLPAFNYLSSSAPATVGGIPAGAVPVSYKSSVMPADAAGCGIVILRAQAPGLPTIVGSFSATPGVAPTLVQVLSSAASASAKVSYTYDARNRLVSTTYGDGSPGITRTYTPDGLLRSISSSGSVPSVWTYDYNNHRLLVRETLGVPGVSSTIQRIYDANAHLAQLSYPGGPSVDYAPDALGAPTRVGGFASAVRWAPNGQLAGYTYGNNIVHSVEQNVRGLPWHANVSAGMIQDTYSYDEEANVRAIADGLPGAVSSRTMAYDGLDRLTLANAPNLWGSASFGYDPLDNVRTSSVGSRSSTRTYDAVNRLVQITTNGAATNYGYDAQGNVTGVTGKGNQAFLFDIGNRLIASGSNGYAYDGHGRRALAYGASGSQRVQMYGQDGQLLYGTYRASASAAASGMRYIYLAGKIIAESSDATGIRYLHTDALGSPVARTDANGTLIDRTRYEPYGATAAGTNPGTGADNVGFTGHANDAATGLVYMQQRYYDPIASRFLSVDPVTTDAGTGGGFNRYAYASNNPYRYTDPDGREPGDAERRMHEGQGWRIVAGDSDGGMSQSARARAVTAGAAFGGTVGAVAAAGCAGITVGVCGLGGPAIVAGGIALGAAGGKAAADLVDWIAGLILNAGSNSADEPKGDGAKDAPKGKEKDVPNRGEPGEVREGQRRTREYGADGKPLRDYDKPHQGHERPHVHEWENGQREHPGRDYSAWPRQGG